MTVGGALFRDQMPDHKCLVNQSLSSAKSYLTGICAVGAFLVWTFWFCCEWFLGFVHKIACRCKCFNCDNRCRSMRSSYDANFGFGSNSGGVRVGSSTCVGSPAQKLSRCWWILWVFVCCRVGEASHPGPNMSDGSSWSVGLCNPSGVNNKISQLNQLQGEAWFICETHLSKFGVSRFRKGLLASRSKYRYFVHGAPCAVRSNSEVGCYSGVGALSQVPMRALPQSFCQEAFATARIQVVGFVVQGVWVQAGVMYGYPDSQQFHERSFQTDSLLHELVDRIAIQGHGPRLICGDFNHGVDDLHNCSRLRQLGFCEAQQFALQRWGLPIQSTSRGSVPIDQMWLSPEMQHMLCRVEIRDCEWADHASIVCHFQGDSSFLQSLHWRMPQQLRWPEQWEITPSVEWHHDPSLAYACFWNQVETGASMLVGQVQKSSLGRGMTLESRPKVVQVPPCKIAREGDFQPSYHGPSIKHLQWVKQLRRCQSLRRLLQSQCINQVHRIRLAEVWAAIRRAPGFPGGFGLWWSLEMPQHDFSLNGFPLAPPSLEEASFLVEVLKQQVHHLERDLIRGRVQGAKQRRFNNLQLLFQDCAKEQPSKVDTLVQSVAAGVDEIRPDDCSVVLNRSVKLADDQPVIIGGRAHEVMASCEDQVWLSDVDSIVPGDVLRQDCVSFTDKDILAKFEEVWSGRWNKLSHLTPDKWRRVSDFVREKFGPIQWQFPEWTSDTFVNAVRGKKRTSATGPDGVSRADLIALPTGACDVITDLYRSLESANCKWPTQLVTGFVSSLNKEKGDGGVDSYRPVTIFPIIFRIWSTVRAKHAMASLAKVLPSSVRGGIPARQARTIWYEISQRLEAANILQQSAQGICLDICKAFNALPREPLWEVLCQIGFPLHILRPWVAFLTQSQRRFKVRSSTGAPVLSNVGFPEGCALSVFAMAVLDWVVACWIEELTPGPTTFVSFVDDWQVLFSRVDQFQGTWEAIQYVVKALDLQLDDDKSFVWAALSRDRTQLVSSPLACKLSARDLGAHQNYCRKAGNRTLVDRVKAMTGVWKLLRTCHSPFRLKCVALLQLAWPRALHGISIVKVGFSHFVSLRTGATRGLKASQVGSNPMLLLSSISCSHDPEAWAILQTFKDARDIGCVEQMHDALVALKHFPEVVPLNGPAAILAERIARLGWDLDKEGIVISDFGSFDLLSCSWETIQFRFHLSWPRVLASEVSHRKSFSGIQCADLMALWDSLKGYGEIDLIYLRSALAGTLYTDIGKDKSERGSNTRCLHCGCQDSFRHRIWECPSFASCRLSFQWNSLLDFLPDCLVCHGWPVIPKAWLELVEYLEQIPVQHDLIAWPVSPLPPVVDLFVDGACACPKFKRLRFASWAVTVATSSDVTSLDHHVVAAGHLSGAIQSAYRAELTAIISALRHVWQLGGNARIWSDNDAVVKLARKALKLSLDGFRGSHLDLVQQLQQLGFLLQGRDVQIVKVVSHCSSTTGDLVETWAFWHNGLVDQLAGTVNFRRSEDFWYRWQRAAEAIRFQGILLRDIQAVLIKVGRMARSSRANSGDDQRRDGAHLGRQGGEKVPRLPAAWAISQRLSKKYLPVNMGWVHRWWTEVGIRLIRQPGPLVWVSGLQLYGDFRMHTEFTGLLSPRHGVWFESIEAAGGRVSLGFASRTTMFLNVLSAYWKEHQFRVVHRLNRPHSSVIACWTMTYLLPWSLARLQRIDQELFDQVGRQVVAPKELNQIEAFHGSLPA